MRQVNANDNAVLIAIATATVARAAQACGANGRKACH